MLLAHKIEIRPTTEQEEKLRRWVGTSRHCFNHLLGHFSKEGVKFSKKGARSFMYENLRTEYEWYSEVSQAILQESINDLENSYKRFFKKISGYPKFKSKYSKSSFSIRESKKFKIEGRNLYLEKFNKSKKGKPLKLRELLRFKGKTKQVTVSFHNDKWYASILVGVENYNSDYAQFGSVGVDLGIKDLATLSNGDIFHKSNKLALSLKRLKKLQRNLSKKKKGSNRYAKAKLSISKLHLRVKNQREALLHNVSNELTSKYKTICLEDLSVSSMTKGKNKKLNRMILDVGMYELRRQLEYKSLLRGVDIHFVDRYYPSSKLHYECGFKNEDLKLGESTWKCKGCGQQVDRDLNASKNILKEGLRVAKQ
ncbi:transposase [Vibrio phage 355E48.1]|nr:transposase [Vibrio phage 355E48.1]